MARQEKSLKQNSSKTITRISSNLSKKGRKISNKNASKSASPFEEKLETKEESRNLLSDVSATETIAPTDRYYNIITLSRFKALQKQAEAAIKAGKTFLMRARWPIVRNTFLDRGWIELYERHYNQNPSSVSKLNYYDVVRHLPVLQSNETILNYTSRCERYILSRLIEHAPVSFMWSWFPNKTDFDQQIKYPSMIINKLLVSPFVSKECLTRDLRANLTWLTRENEIEVNYPRSYCTTDPEQIVEFIQNFRKTACIGFLRYIVEKAANSNLKLLLDDNPSTEIPYAALEFALQRCYELLNFYKHNDIDIAQPSLVTDRDWNHFFEHHSLLTQKKGQFRKDRIQSIDSILRNAEMLLESISPYLPEYNLDGFMNIWIIKPADGMCGKGIHISNNIKRIKDLIQPKQRPIKKFIVQKYIERPFTIYNTKFEIRQYFLITNVFPLVIWIYTENYLRFSTKPYRLNDFHESIHVTNNAIQQKYQVDPKRDSRLPHQNMWDCFTFQAYLRQIGKRDVWENQIYPGIKQAIIGTVLSAQQNMIQRNNAFQLYGADFILSEDLKPWIIEINGCPNLYLSTNVTSRIVPQCVNDLFKGNLILGIFENKKNIYTLDLVVVDRKHDPNAGTGNFELIYSQSLTPNITAAARKLSVVGKQISNPTYQVRREMYQHLIQQSSNPANRRLISASTVAKPFRRGSDIIDASVRSHFEDRPSSSAPTQDKLEMIKQNLKKITHGS